MLYSTLQLLVMIVLVAVPYLATGMLNIFIYLQEGEASNSSDGGASAIASCRNQHQFALLEFERPVICSPDAVIIGSRLDVDVYILLIYSLPYWISI